MINIEIWNKFFKALGSYIKNLIIFAASCFVSWAMSMVIIWVLFKLMSPLFIKFDITTFSVQVATGIWLALFLLEKFIEGSLANRLKNVIYKL